LNESQTDTHAKSKKLDAIKNEAAATRVQEVAVIKTEAAAATTDHSNPQPVDYKAANQQA
jgi:hypothetical protein